jgi:hypothetical protein
MGDLRTLLKVKIWNNSDKAQEIWGNLSKVEAIRGNLGKFR